MYDCLDTDSSRKLLDPHLENTFLDLHSLVARMRDDGSTQTQRTFQTARPSTRDHTREGAFVYPFITQRAICESPEHRATDLRDRSPSLPHVARP